jgi:hypothetical protein
LVFCCICLSISLDRSPDIRVRNDPGRSNERRGKQLMRTVLSISRLCFLFWISACLFCNIAAAQLITVQLLNGKNGKPIGNATVHISFRDDANQKTLDLTTNSQGLIQFEANGSKTFQVHQIGFATCGEQPIGSQPRDYPIDRVLDAGLVSVNNCGHFIQEPKRGRLIFFVRHGTLGEWLKQ